MSYYCGWCGKTFDNSQQKPTCTICQKAKSPEVKTESEQSKDKSQTK